MSSCQEDATEIVVGMMKEISSFLGRRISNRDDRDDVVSECILRALEHVGSVEDTSKIPQWLYKISRNALIDYYRVKGKKVEVSFTDYVDDSGNSVIIEELESYAASDKRLEDSPVYEKILLVNNIIAESHRLGSTLADTFMLYFVHHKKYKEIASLLNIPEGTVKSRIFKIRRLIRGKLSR